MAKRKIGYKSPPPGRPFKPGQSGNPKGRPPRTSNQLGEIVQEVLNNDMEYRKDGKARKAPRHEVSIKVLTEKATKGDVVAADLLFRKRIHALHHGQNRTRRLLVVNWLPDYSGQTGKQKAQSLTGQTADSTPPPGKNERGDQDQCTVADNELSKMKVAE